MIATSRSIQKNEWWKYILIKIEANWRKFEISAQADWSDQMLRESDIFCYERTTHIAEMFPTFKAFPVEGRSITRDSVPSFRSPTQGWKIFVAKNVCYILEISFPVSCSCATMAHRRSHIWKWLIDRRVHLHSTCEWFMCQIHWRKAEYSSR